MLKILVFILVNKTIETLPFNFQLSSNCEKINLLQQISTEKL